jgi:transcriptional regulator with XRE-family HTH domain
MSKNTSDKRCLALGKNIKKLREKRQWSQEKLSEKADIHVSYIGQIERGMRYPSLKTLFKLADAMGVKIGEIFRGIDGS